jgi:hypothetical protein
MDFFLELIGTFGGPPSGSSFALKPIAIEPTDSVPLVLSRTRYDANGSWTAVATVPNGGRFELFIDRTNRQGEFRSLGAADDDKVLRALAGVASMRR